MRVLVLILLALLASCTTRPEHVKVLIIDGQNNHNWKATTPVLLEAYVSNPMFKVDVSTSPDKKGGSKEQWDQWRPQFQNYDVIVSNYNGQEWPDEVKKSFEAYVKNGGGFVCIHAANNSFSKWEEYNKMIGLGGWGGRTEKHGPYVFVKDGKVVCDHSPGRGGSHGPRHEFCVHTFDASHPIMKGIPAKWMHTQDELYDSLRGPGENMKVLAYAYSEKSKKNEPMIMVLDYGKGRVFHTPLGHDTTAMNCKGFVNIVLRGTEWAAFNEVTIPVAQDFPTAEKSQPFSK